MKRLKTDSLNATVQEQIREYIIEHGLNAGDMLPTEKTLEEELGISRTSIREALRALEALGIVESRHGVGRFLRDFNYDAVLAGLSYNMEVNVENFRDIIEVRIALEHSFIARAAKALSAAQIAGLRELVAKMETQNDRAEDERALIATHTQFHLRLYEPLQNRLLSHLIEMFSTVQRSLTVLQSYRTSDRDEFVRLHRELVDALEARDPGLAQARLREHFKDVIAWSEAHTPRESREQRR